MDPHLLRLDDSGLDRLRSGQACLTCRRRKNKCDGSRPLCSFCRKKNWRCIYDVAEKGSGVDRRYIETLEQKVRRLEQEIRRMGESSPSELPTIRQCDDDALVNDFQRRHPQPRTKVVRMDNIQPVVSDVNSTSLERDNDLVTVVKYADISIHSAVADFGFAPSGTSPSDTMRVGTDVANDDQTPGRVSEEDIRDQNYHLDSNSLALPDRDLAQRLVDLYYENVAPILPLVHEPTFRSDFDEMYSKNKPVSIAFRSLINVIFAYGCDYLELDLPRTYELSQEFHERATGLILLVCYELASLQVVQALLLLTLHLNSSMQFHRMWINTGLLVRTGQALNLHLDPSDWNTTIIEKEIRKRLWWSIYSLDRFISLKHCRPPALHLDAGHPVLPTAVDDDQIMATSICEGDSPGRQPSQLHFFNSLMRLIPISETALSSRPTSAAHSFRQDTNSIPKGNVKRLIYAQMSVALEQESQLAAWLDELPAHLQFDYNNTDRKLRKQQRSLQIRYQHTRLMIHRPNMIFALKPENSRGNLDRQDTFLQSILSDSIQQCIACSCELIGLVRENYEKNDLGPWWLLLQFIFTTLATLYAVLPKKNLVKNLDKSKVHTAIENAMFLLRSFGDVSPVLIQCRRYFGSIAASLGPQCGGDNSYEHRFSLDGQFQPSLLVTTAGNPPTSHESSASRVRSVADWQAHNLNLFSTDHSMADYSAELFSDATFGQFNFGALDPILQM